MRCWPVETGRPQEAAPAGTCTRCGAILSRYRGAGETACAPRKAASRVAPTPLVEPCEGGASR